MRNRAPAFTLVELLVALAITSVLVVLLASMVSATLGAWRQGRNRLDTFSSARQLISRFGDEIGAAIAAPGRIQFVENDGSVGPSTAKTSENVFFVSPYPNLGAGDLCVIAYRHDASARRLERAFIDSANAWAAPTGARYRVAGYSGSGAGGLQWRTIAEGVLEFEIQSFSQAELDSNVVVPADTWNSESSLPTMQGKTPRRVVLRIKVVDDRTMARLDALAPAAIEQAAREFFADFALPAR